MGTAWETLFHLSSFMKYLLIEVVPKEQLDSPKYVSESLLELLNVTLDCLNLIRSKNGPGVISHRSSFQAEVEKATSSLASYRSNLNENTTYINLSDSHNKCQDIEIVANSQHIQGSVEPSKNCFSSSNSRSLNSLIKHNSTVISQNFITLSNDILTGNCFGYYCLPCDSIFTDEIQWKSHCDNWDHITKIKKIKCAEFHCEKCPLLVFGNSTISSIYIDFHSQKTHKTSSHTSSEYPSSDIPNRIGKTTPGETNAVNSGSIASENSINISSKFEKVQSKMIKGFQKEGFYCNFCDEKFYSNRMWVEHFQKRELHSQKDSCISNGKFESCEICFFTIFANKDVVNQLIIYHRHSHSLYSSNSQNISAASSKSLSGKIKDNSVASASNIDRIGRVSRSTSKSEDLNTEGAHDLEQYDSSSDVSLDKKAETKNKNRKFIFTQTFLELDNKIHSRSLVSAFYCRPCDQYCPLEDIENHCLTGKHVNFIKSKNFKNFQGECAHCKLTIVGTDRTVHESMRFHAKGHNRVPSYTFEPINEQEDTKARNRRSRAKTNKSRQISTNRTEDVEFPHSTDHSSSRDEWNNKANDAESVQNESRNNDGNDDSWYKLSTNETFMSELKELYMYRLKTKNRSHTFAGFCVPCEFVVGSAFEWVDHLDSDEHCSIQIASDNEFQVSDLNMRIFGNKTLIQSHSIL